MHFEHLVQINDLLNPLIDPLSREQLWQGLVLRAENPLPFTLGLDRFDIAERTEQGFRRALYFGSAVIRDQVTFTPLQSVHYQITPALGQSSGSLLMQIEEPASDQLFVRFVYHTQVAEGAEPITAEYAEFLKSAYEQADWDTIRLIRQFMQTA